MKTIMVVDDNKLNLYVLQVILQADGYQVVSALNGAEAIEQARKDPPDLVISDILMPIMDGFSLCRNMKQDPDLKNIPIVFYSATYTDPQDIEFALSLGAARFIIKPAEPTTLSKMVKDVIEDAKRGQLQTSELKEKREPDYLVEYNARLIKKLEDKLEQLDKANRELEFYAKELTHQRDHFHLLHRLDRLMRSTISCPGLADLVTKELEESLDVDIATLWLLDNSGQYQRIETIHDDIFDNQFILPQSDLLIKHMGRISRPLLAFDANDPEYCCYLTGLKAQDVKSFLATPLTIMNQLGGFLLLLSTREQRSFSVEEVQLVENISSQVSICINNANLFSSVERSEQRYRTILQGSADAIISIDTQGKIEEWSIGAEQLFGFKRDQVLGKKLENLFPQEARQSLDKALQQMRENGFVKNWQTQQRTINKQLVDVEVTLTNMGPELGYTAIMHDISKRKQDEEKIKASEAKYRNIFESSPVAIKEEDFSQIKMILEKLKAEGVTDLAAYFDEHPGFLHQLVQTIVIRDVNAATLKVFEANRKEDLLGSIEYTIDDESWDLLRDSFIAIFQGKNYFRGTTINKSLQGRRMNMLLTFSFPEKKEEFDRVLVSSIDITDRVLAEKALKKSQESLSKAQSIAHLGNWFWNLIEDELTCSDEVFRIFGFNPGEIKPSYDAFFSKIHPDDQSRIIVEMNNVRYGPHNDLKMEHRIIRADGKACNVQEIGEITRDENGKAICMIGTIQDITERIHWREEIRQRTVLLETLNAIIGAAASATSLQQLLDTTIDRALKAINQDMGAIWISPYMSVKGLPSTPVNMDGQRISNPFKEVLEIEIVTDWEQIAPNHFLEKIKEQIIAIGVRATISVPITANNIHIGALSMGSRKPRKWNKEEIAFVEAIGKQLGDAAERLRLQETTRRQVLEMQQIMNTVPDGVILLDADFKIVQANPAAEEALSILAQKSGDSISTLGDQPLENLLFPPPTGLRHQLTVKGHNPRYYELVARPLRTGNDEEGWVVVISDVTQERVFQERTQQQERLAAVGQLAAGIAHDFNNIMAIITLYAQMTMNMPDVEENKKRMEVIFQQAIQASNLISQILDFSRQSVYERKPLAIIPFIKEVVKLLERTLPDNIELKLDHTKQDLVVNADPTRIQQAIMNLAINATHAMPEGGQLSVRLSRLEILSGGPKPVPEIEPGHWVELDISDSGIGIPQENMPHIFEPFFTTKGTGEGTGLGLAQVFGIVKQHAGHITVSSQLYQGTTFAIFLPALDIHESKEDDSDELVLFTGDGQLVLVVEDNPMVREAVQEALETLNYRTMKASNGREALQVLHEHEEIALVISDIMMPIMGGRDLLRTMRNNNIDTRILFMSGHPLQDKDNTLAAEGVVGWIQKPPRLAQLGQVLHRIFDN